MSGTALAVVIIVVALIIVAAIVLAVVRSRRRRALKDRFGSEYDHTVGVTDSKRQAERDLRERASRRDELDIRDLSPAAASRYQEQWQVVQQRFVDEPVTAVNDAQGLVTTVMGERGYPTRDGDERESMLSVDHSDVIDRYRSATEIEGRARTGKATTEDLRQAMQHYRALFDRLLGDSVTTGSDPYADEQSGTVPGATGRRGSRVGPDA